MSEHLNDLQINRLHDGRMDLADAASVSAVMSDAMNTAERDVLMAHVRECAACADRLAELDQLSHVIASAQVPGLSQIARARVRRNVLAETTQRSLIRLAEAFSGLAAAVLIGGLLWLSRTPANAKLPTVTASIETPPPWIDTATPGVPKIDSVTNTPAARWYLADTASHVEEAL